VAEHIYRIAEIVGTSPNGVDDAIRVPRNQRATQWLLNSSYHGNHKNIGGTTAVQRLLLDFSGVADLKHMPKTSDEIHYMCIWQPKLPELVTASITERSATRLSVVAGSEIH
jgi:hypothetical protein